MLSIFFYTTSVISAIGFVVTFFRFSPVNFGLLVSAAVLWLCALLVEFMRETRQHLKDIQGLIVMFERDRKRENSTD